MRASSRLPGTIKRIVRSNWLFPSIILFFILCASFIGTSGSSVNVYNGGLNNKLPRESNLVRFDPQIIRSDEWLVMTQMVAAQASQDYPVINKTIGNGQDMAVVLDVPYREWSIIFKPQNLVFLVAPLDFAFAFKWWFLAGLLAISTYVFVLALLPKRRDLAVLIGLIAMLSPFLQWWYQSITIIPMALGFLILAILLRLRKPTENKVKKLGLYAALTYCITSFGLVMYPPFQIGIFLVIAVFYIGIIVQDWPDKKRRKNTKTNLFTVIGCGAIAVILLGLFLLQHQTAIKSFTQTTYPGNRSFDAGNFPFWHFNGPYLGIFQQDLETAGNYRGFTEASNQSTSSNFMIPAIPLLLFGVLLAIRAKRAKRKTPILLVSMLIILSLYLLHLFVPLLEPLYKIFGLHLIAHTRLLLGVGMASIVLLCLIIQELAVNPLQLSKKYILGISVLLMGYFGFTTYIINAANPGFIGNMSIAVILTLGIVIFLLLLLCNKIIWSLVVLLLVSFFSVNRVHPLNRSLDELTSTQLAATIREIAKSDPAARWATDTNSLENYPQANGAKSLSGTYNYPQLSIWQSIDQDGKNEAKYNRYAHINFQFDDSKKTPEFKLIAKDSLHITISSCDPFLDKYNVKYIHTLNPRLMKCFSPLYSFTYRSNSVFIYERHSAR